MYTSISQQGRCATCVHFTLLFFSYTYLCLHLYNILYNNIIFVPQKKGIVPSTSTATTTTSSGGPPQRPAPPTNIGMFQSARRIWKIDTNPLKSTIDKTACKFR